MSIVSTCDSKSVRSIPVTPRVRIQGLAAEDIEWIWIIELKRRATKEEVADLCAGAYLDDAQSA